MRCRAVADDLAVPHGDHPVGLCRDIGLVGDYYYGPALVAVEALQDIHDLFAGAAVEVACRLVGKQDRRVLNKRPGNTNPLLLSA